MQVISNKVKITTHIITSESVIKHFGCSFNADLSLILQLKYGIKNVRVGIHEIHAH